jgi:transposase
MGSGRARPPAQWYDGFAGVRSRATTASATAATIQDTSSFAGPREFAAFSRADAQAELIGRQAEARAHFEDGQSLFAANCLSWVRMRCCKPHTDPLQMWAKKQIEKKPFKLVAVALANKMARIAFAILWGKTGYREIPP